MPRVPKYIHKARIVAKLTKARPYKTYWNGVYLSVQNEKHESLSKIEAKQCWAAFQQLRTIEHLDPDRVASTICHAYWLKTSFGPLDIPGLSEGMRGYWITIPSDVMT